MISIVEELINGNSEIPELFQKAKDYWNDILCNTKLEDTEELANVISGAQIAKFEHNCGGRWLGQEIMATVGIAQFFATDEDYETQYNNATLMLKAFKRSTCSLEVKGHAREIANAYSLNDNEGY